MTDHLVSIIMPSFNHKHYIGAAIESVFSQSYQGLELIVSDGGSTDGTQSLLQEKSIKYANLHWLSQPDSGPAEALNNCLSRARGTIIGWLNADDLYADECIEKVLLAFSENAEWIMVYGHGEHVNERGHYISRYPSLRPSVGAERFSSGCFICQPTVFFKRTMPLLLGPFDEGLKTTFDYDYWIRAFLAFSRRIGFVDSVLAQSRVHENTITARMRRTVAIEGVYLTSKFLGRGQVHWITTYIEELLAMSPGERGFSKIEPHINEFLTEVRSFLSVSDINIVAERVRGL